MNVAAESVEAGTCGGSRLSVPLPSPTAPDVACVYCQASLWRPLGNTHNIAPSLFALQLDYKRAETAQNDAYHCPLAGLGLLCWTVVRFHANSAYPMQTRKR